MTSRRSKSYGVYLYVPVIHEGIRRWLLSHSAARFVAIVGPKTLDRYRPIVKDIRRLPTDDIVVALRSLQLARDIRVLEFDELSMLVDQVNSLVMPKDELFATAANYYLPASVEPVFESVFLRWDRDNVHLANPQVAQGLPSVRLASIWQDLEALRSWSPDWWRQVASALVIDDGVVVTAYNHPLPNEEAVLTRGDPRALFKKGLAIELSSYIHAEAQVIAAAARQGISTAGAQLYVTTFPCPVCAKLLAAAGISRLYYRAGYSTLDGADVLTGAGVEIIHVQ